MTHRDLTASARLVPALLAALVMAGAAPLVAQDGEEVEEVTIEPESERDEILVTGARSSVTDVSDEAAAVTAFGMDELDQANIADVEGLAFNVPSLHVGVQGNQVIVTLRGIGTQNASPNGEPGVAYLVDGVNFVRPVSAQVAFFDLEGVQVKRGPQGTRGGKNANAGWIDVTTRKPGSDFEISGDVQVGSFNERRWRMALNLPVNEYFQTRTALIYSNRDGYLENEFLDDDDRDPFDTDDFGLRQHLQFQPTESVESLFTYNYYRQDGNGTQAKLIPRLDPVTVCGRETRLPRGPACQTVQTLRDQVIQLPGGGTFTRPNQWDGTFQEFRADDSLLEQPDKILSDTPSTRDNRFWGFTSTTTWQAPVLPGFGETQLKGIGSFQRIDSSFLTDFDTTNEPLNTLSIPEQTEQSSAELQWSSVGGQRLDWQLSGFYLRQDSDQSFSLETLEGFNPDTNERFLGDFMGIQNTLNTSYGLALHTDWYPLEDLTVSTGIRYTKDTRDLVFLREIGLDVSGFELEDCTGGASDPDNNFTPNKPFDPATGTFPEDLVPSCQRTYRDFSGGVNIEWRPLEDQLFYFRTDRGFKSGGFANLGFGEYDPEFIWAYSLGTKGAFFDDRLQVNLETFYYDYKDLQIVNIDGITFRTENLDAEIFGVDLEIESEPIPGLNLKAAIGYLDTEVTDFLSIDPIDKDERASQALHELDPISFPPGNPTDYSGNELSRSPEWTLTLGASYDIYLGRYGRLTPRIQYYWQDDTYYRVYNDRGDLQEAYHLTDVGLTWHSPQENWTVEGFVTNLEDDNVYQNVLIGPSTLESPQNAWYGAPRIWGLRVGYAY